LTVAVCMEAESSEGKDAREAGEKQLARE